jgi:ABC-2 type transport system ATP-binding protein
MDKVLQATGLTKRFASVGVVHGVNFSVHRGEIVGYLGPNGSGKTVTLRMATGLLAPNDGVVLYKGLDIQSDLVAYRRNLGYVPDEPHLYPFLSGREHLELVGRLRQLPERLLSQKIPALLELFGILDAADQPMSGYSKGMKQKVMIIAALLHDPELLILDEPESGLDVTSTLVLGHLVKALAARGKAVLYSSHLLDLIERTCTRVVVIHRGRVVADDSAERLRALMSTASLQAVFAQLVLNEDPAKTARDIADVAALRA